MGNFSDVIPAFDVPKTDALMELMGSEAADLWCAAGWFVTRQDVRMICWGLGGGDSGVSRCVG